jgi:hypothetical protein
VPKFFRVQVQFFVATPVQMAAPAVDPPIEEPHSIPGTFIQVDLSKDYEGFDGKLTGACILQVEPNSVMKYPDYITFRFVSHHLLDTGRICREIKNLFFRKRSW